ncbi:MAG TPA: Rrf2 family transcriptional regulator [Verrucomicrobiae bacterium]
MKLSVKSDYATRAVLSLARSYAKGGVTRVEDVAREHGIPANYLVQIMIELKSKRIVRSQRGKEGGYSLAQPPEKITFGDVLRAVHGGILETPALDDPQCPPETRAAWLRLREAAETAADSLNFQQLIEQAEEKQKMYYI